MNPWFEREEPMPMPLTLGMILCLESGFVVPGRALARSEKEILVEEARRPIPVAPVKATLTPPEPSTA